jgi:hypothetical protein
MKDSFLDLHGFPLLVVSAAVSCSRRLRDVWRKGFDSVRCCILLGVGGRRVLIYQRVKVGRAKVGLESTRTDVYICIIVKCSC